MQHKELRFYVAANGKQPFAEWLKKIKDPTTKARILRRLDYLTIGNYGDFKSVGDGVFELRLTFGAGYRIYFAENGKHTVILLMAGDKSSQSKDITLAKKYWLELKRRMK